MLHAGAALPALSAARGDQPFTNILWALGCWEHHPPAEWLREYCRCVTNTTLRLVALATSRQGLVGVEE